MPHVKKLLGERLIELGVISKPDLEAALREQRRTGEILGKVLQAMGSVTEREISAALASELDIPNVGLATSAVDPELLRIVPKELALHHRLFPVSLERRVLTVAMANPYDIIAIDTIQHRTGHLVDVAAAAEADVLAAIEKHYDGHGEAATPVRAAAQQETRPDEEVPPPAAAMELDASAHEALDEIIGHAVDQGATTIHIQPDESVIRTRYRVDGVLRAGPDQPKERQVPLSTQIKQLARLDAFESARAQDGRFRFGLHGRQLDIRAAILPTTFGEDLVLRLSDESAPPAELHELGMPPDVASALEGIMAQPRGLVIVTGPRDCGKTTTLYSLLRKLNTEDRNTVTLESPVEQQLAGVRQAELPLGPGFTYAAALDAALRQEPDVVMIDEIRDLEAAQIAMRAALAGHFMLGAFHAGTAVAALRTLLDMGAEPFLLSASITALLAQRLVRKICPDCKEPAEPGAPDLEWLSANVEDGPRVCAGKGCDSCAGSGYRGRTGLFEILVPDAEMAQTIVRQAPRDELERLVAAKGMRHMTDDGKDKVLAGITTVSEVLRVTA